MLRKADTDHFVCIDGAVLISYAVRVAYLLLEQRTDHAFKRALFTLLPSLRPPTKHAATDTTNLHLSD